MNRLRQVTSGAGTGAYVMADAMAVIHTEEDHVGVVGVVVGEGMFELRSREEVAQVIKLLQNARDAAWPAQ